MWLVAKNRILTKQNLQRKGWQGNPSSQFCGESETTSHFFIQCRLSQHIWFWMGKNQEYFREWSSIKDIIAFALTLPEQTQT